MAKKSKRRKGSPKVVPRPAEPSTYLFVSVTRDAVRVLKAARVPSAPRDALLRAPVLTEDAARKYEGDESELVLAVIHHDNTSDEQFAWAAEPEAFVDDASGRAVKGSSVQLTEWEARWRIPMRDAARYLQFYRTDSTQGSDDRTPTFRQTSLGVFDLKPGDAEPPRRRWPVPDSRPPLPLPLPPLADARPRSMAARSRHSKPAKAKKKKATPEDGGFIKGSTTLLNNGDPSTKFNVVILGDGFTSRGLRVFDKYAAVLKKALTTMEPYKGLISRINVFKVSVVSAESGITNCPKCGSGIRKNSFLQTTGCWKNLHSPTFIGVASTAKLLEAVETAVPQELAHLVITIVNCRRYGGSTPPELGLTFLALPARNEKNRLFMQLAMHESGHVAGLCEEYNPCNKKQATRIYPNEATQAEVDAGTVKWKDLALASELDSSGRFKVIFKLGDPVTPDCQPRLPAAELKSLGAFWGCHNGHPPSTLAAPPVGRCDPRGRHFYRSMANCRMRSVDAEFCRACTRIITHRILAVST